MLEERISSGYTVIMQGVLCFFGVLFWLGLILLLGDGLLEIQVLLFVSAMAALFFLGFRQLLSFADIYVTNDHVVFKKVIGTQQRLFSEIKRIDEGFLPINYYIEFKGGNKVYFQLKSDDLLTRFGSSNSKEAVNKLKLQMKVN
jgi:hypothetical protein